MLIIVIVLFQFVQGCETQTNDGDIIVMPQKNPEDASFNTDNDIGVFNNMSVLRNSSQNAASNYYFNPPGKVLDMIPMDRKWLDFEVYDRYIFLIEKTGETVSGLEYGKSIMVYDTELQSHINTFEDSGCEYTAVTEFEGFIYAYEYLKGEIHKYGTDGDLKDKSSISPELEISKLKFSKEGWLAAMISSKGEKIIAIYDENLTDKFVLKPMDLSDKTDLHITDFDMYDEDSILLKASDGILYLYNFKQGKLEKERYIGKESGLICYNSNILYWTSEMRTAVLTSNSIQMAYIASPETLGRLFMNRGFPWDSKETLDEWTLEPLEIPGEWMGSVHYRIKSWGGFVYILDYIINGTSGNKGLKSYIIRVEK